MRGGPMVDPRELLVETRRELARFAELLPMLVAGLEGAAWRARPRPAEWSPVEIVCHLRDEEVDDFGARLRVILAGDARFARLAATAERPNGGRLSGLDLLASWVAHDRLHLQQLAGTLARLWATRWAPLDVDYAGPIPYRD
jgi:hypothetical protein